MLKPRLMRIVDEVFEGEGIHDPKRDLELREKLLDFLKEEDHLILPSDDPNLVLARDTVRLIDVDKVFAQTVDRKQAYPYVKSFFERLMRSDPNEWSYYELQFLASSIHFTESIEQAMKLATMAENRILRFKCIRLTELLECVLASNICSRLLNEKYFNSGADIDFLTREFKLQFRKVEKLAEQLQQDSKLSLIFLVSKIREALFKQHSTDAFQLCTELEAYHDAKLAKLVDDEVHFYTASKEYIDFES